ncbi:hypothetical protein I547_3242 [Mycobacterium kansasii 824]|nr:hypothetical protein I547_3242 [Mycobacterium kansasii 824]
MPINQISGRNTLDCNGSELQTSVCPAPTMASTSLASGHCKPTDLQACRGVAVNRPALWAY